jgi:hypothetical protein
MATKSGVLGCSPVIQKVLQEATLKALQRGGDVRLAEELAQKGLDELPVEERSLPNGFSLREALVAFSREDTSPYG